MHEKISRFYLQLWGDDKYLMMERVGFEKYIKIKLYWLLGWFDFRLIHRSNDFECFD